MTAESVKRTAALFSSLVVGTFVGGTLLWFVVRPLDLHATWKVLEATDWPTVLAALVAMISMWIVKSVRWIAILRGVAELRLPDSLAAVVVGAAGNLVVSHTGMALRILAASRRCGIPAETLLTSVGVERAFDSAIIFLVVSVAIFFGGHGRLPHLEWILGGLALGAAILFIVVLRAGPRIADWLESQALKQPSPMRIRLAGALRRVVAALRLFDDRRQALIVLAWSTLMWACVIGCIYLCIHAVSGEAMLLASVLVLGVHTVALVLPAPPAKVGITQASFALALAGTVLTSPQIFAASVIYNVLMTLPVMLAGLFTWRSVLSKADAAQLPSG